ncbi:MAG: hypothetical protein NO516_00510 [Candidatus Methanomethylicia archaeon]|nr:hypothetical protein [Candidatus Methanomethylicia archaeon]
MKTKVAMFPAAIAVALLAMAMAYGLWYQTLTVEGEVETGRLEVCITGVSALDMDIGSLDWTSSPRGFLPNASGGDYWRIPDAKDVGRTIVEVRNCSLYVTLQNVYPCYFTDVTFKPFNTGTLPWIIDTAVFKDNNGDVVATARKGTPYVLLDLNDDQNADIEILWLDNFGTQVHPYDPNVPGSGRVEISFYIHVLQEAPQGATLTFSIELTVVQWNEYIPPK